MFVTQTEKITTNLRYSNMAMDNPPFTDGFHVKPPFIVNCPLPWLVSGGYIRNG